MKKGTKRLIGLLVFLAIATAAAIFIIQNEGQGSKQAAVKPTEAAENSVANEQEAPEQAFLVYENAEVNCIIDVADSGSVALATGADHISYEVIDGDMPKGLTIAEDGTILGAYPRPMKGRVVTVRASAEGCDPVEAEITINVVKPFLTFTGTTLADAKAGVEYAASVAYISDTTEKVTFKLAKGSVLPEGLTLNKNGVITGTPTTVQRGVPFTVVAEAKGYSDTEAVFKLDVIIDHKSNETGTILNYNGGDLKSAYENEYYLNQTGVAAGVMSLNNNELTFELAEGSQLPEGLTLYSNGAIFGTPKASRVQSFDIIAHAAGCEDQRRTFTLNIMGSQVGYDNSMTLEGAIRGEAFDRSVATAYAGEEMITYSVDEKNAEILKELGLALSSDGELTGTPTRSTKRARFTVIASAEGYSEATCTVYMNIQEPMTETTVFEAEYLNLAGKTGVGYSGAPADEGLICRNETAGNHFFLGYLHSPNMYFEYTIYSGADTEGELLLSLGQELGDDISFDPSTLDVSVNGVSLSFGSFHVPGARQSYTVFEEFSAGKIKLNAGENKIRITVKPNTLFGGATGGPGLDYIRIDGASAPLMWQPCLYNFDLVVI